MAQQTGYKKERPTVLGEHTAISIAKNSGKWKEIAYLKDNDGMLPPNMIVVGDRRRVNSATALLSEYIPLHERVEKLVGPHGSGRVNVVLGVYAYKGKPLPLTILETQMGMSAQDIIAWEALVNSDETGYTLHGERIPANGISVIRAGTCGGIIMSEGGKQVEEPFISIGDMVVANASIADAAVARQRMGCWTSCDEEEMKLFKELWKKDGLGFTMDGKWPILYSSRPVIHALATACAEVALKAHFGTNISKESLYMEGDEERLKMLRALHLVFSTEMEHFGLAYLAHLLNKAGIPVQNSLISTVVGTIPGGSFAFPGTPEDKLANANIQKMLDAAMLALWKLTYDPWQSVQSNNVADQEK